MQVAGTQLYMAPEVLIKKCDTKSDMFGAGLILIELLFNCARENHDDILFYARHDKFPEAFYNELEFALPVLKQLLALESCDRLSSNELLNIMRTNPDWVS